MAQFTACLVEYKKDNIFGSTVFGAFGLFWLSVALVWLISSGVFGEAMQKSLDMKQFGFVCLAYFLLFAFPLTFGAAEAHKVLFFIFIAVDVLLAAMALNYFGIAQKQTQLIAGIAELITWVEASTTLIDAVVGSL